MNSVAKNIETETVNGYQRHELSAAWGDLPEDELQALADSIKSGGLLDPITLLDGKVLDGWNRNRACLIAGVTPQTREFVLTDPVEFVIRKNGLRRSLSAGQKAMIAVEILSLIHI